MSHPEPPNRILIRTTNWLGDALLTYPAVGFLRRRFPAARLSLLARPLAAAVFEHCPLVDEILVAPDTSGRGGRWDPLREARLIRRGRFERAYVLPNSFATALSVWLGRVPQRVGYATDGRGWLLSEPVPVTPDVLHVHQVYYYLRLAGHTAGDPPPPAPRLHLTEAELAAAGDAAREAFGGPTAGYVVFVPGATYGTAKRWPPARYAEIGRRLARAGRRVLVLGSPAERPLGEEVAAAVGSAAVSLVGRTGVRGAAALLARAALCLTNDTGLMHVAAAAGTPVVAVFGPTDVVTTAPFGDGGRIVRQPVDCSPCLLRHCPIDHRCMERVTEDMVWDAVHAMLHDPT